MFKLWIVTSRVYILDYSILFLYFASLQRFLAALVWTGSGRRLTFGLTGIVLPVYLTWTQFDRFDFFHLFIWDEIILVEKWSLVMTNSFLRSMVGETHRISPIITFIILCGLNTVVQATLISELLKVVTFVCVRVGFEIQYVCKVNFFNV